MGLLTRLGGIPAVVRSAVVIWCAPPNFGSVPRDVPEGRCRPPDPSGVCIDTQSFSAWFFVPDAKTPPGTNTGNSGLRIGLYLPTCVNAFFAESKFVSRWPDGLFSGSLWHSVESC